MVNPPGSPYFDSDDSSFYDDVRYTDKPVPRISLRNFESRVDSITADIAAAAERHGFLILIDHNIPQAAIDAQFATIERFFALPDEIKAKTPYSASCNTGWQQETTFIPPPVEETEKSKPSDHDHHDHHDRDRPDDHQKDRETYCMQFSESLMARRWVSGSDLPGFRHDSLTFMHACHSLSMRIMVCLARGLGLTKENDKDDHIFAKAHAMSQPGIQTVLRAQRYYALDQQRRSSLPTTPTSPTAVSPTSSTTSTQAYRIGSATHADSDWSFLTLRFQRPGQSGLEICPGRETVTHHTTNEGAEWTKVETNPGEIICNVGDLLMFWSDDRYKSTLYRERAPSDPAVDFYGDCYSLAYFNQPSRDCILQGPLCKYPATSAGELMDLVRKRNFSELNEKKQQSQNQSQGQSQNQNQDQKQQMTSVEMIASAAANPNVDAGTAAAAFGASMSSYMETSFM
ncbi:hypothetical protein Sste5346_001175 [Sporothrix stenoceras]|uniref:Uncharacterized protein n=1 Tax=Sporothrix stenoceras TaxID=5173 RepID=A0ABR3ZRF9_9PEZI